MKVTLKDIMTRDFRLCISEEFRLNLFSRAIEMKGNSKRLAEHLECSTTTLRNMKTGKTRFIRWRILRTLLNLLKISKDEIEPHIRFIKGGDSGKITEVSLPIKESSKLSLLIAKGMGDGTIETINMRFSFKNKERALIDEVCTCVNKAIGKTRTTINKRKGGAFEVKFNPFIGFILHLFGVPIGSKTVQSFDVPKWIKNGSKEIKAFFIRGLFDDESTVRNDEKHRTRGIIIAQAKCIKKRDSLEDFFTSIKRLLIEFGIESSKITRQNNFVDRNGTEKIILRFSISRKRNLENFLNRIGFTHPKKQQKLRECIESFKDIHRSKRLIMNVIMESGRPLSTREIADSVGINRKLALHHLLELSKNKKLVKSKGMSPAFWFTRESPLMISKKMKVFGIIKNSGKITAKNISKLTGVKEGVVFWALKKLEKENMIKKTGLIQISVGPPSALWSVT